MTRSSTPLAHAVAKRHPALRAVAALLALSIAAQPVVAQTTVDLSNNPMAGRNPAKPNIMIGYDDSGSMDWETIASGTRDGVWWWSSSQSNGLWNVSTTTSGGGKKKGGGTTVTTTTINASGSERYGYLFPNGTTSSATGDNRKDSDSDTAALPPIGEFAFARSFDYNPLYYNPATRYNPWPQAYIDGALRTFSNATPSAARSHPYFPLSGTATTLDVGSVQYQATPTTGWTFRFRQNMTIPASVPWHTNPIIYRQAGSTGGWTTATAAFNVPSGESYDVMIPYLPAQYWKVVSSCPGGVPATDCATQYDGRILQRVAIESGTTSYPKSAARTDCAGSTCTYAEELQNFANWFQYHRKRRLAMASGMGAAFATVTGIRADSIYFNAGGRPDATMYDFSSTADSSNGKVVLGKFFRSNADSGTPIRSMLKFLGEQYQRTGTGAPIQYGCQRNAAFIVTDGYNTDTSTTAPSYDRSTWVNSAPYTNIIDDSIADIAGALYTNNPRSDLPTGLLAIDATATGNNVDQNTNLHVNTYAITLGATGTIFGTSSPSFTNPWVNPPTWPGVGTASSTAQIDDLWHATINGRGQMFNVYNAAEVTNAINTVVRSLLTSAGSDAGIAVSSYNLGSGNNTAYVSSFNAQNWSGQLAAYAVDLATGNVVTTPGSETWSARDQLNSVAPSSRIIASHDGTTGVRFSSGTGAGNLPASLVNQMALTSTSADGAQVLQYIRGDRTGEGSTYRARTHVLGDIVSAEPVFDNGVVYQPANDGMLHAFDAANGAELWAYVPYNVIPNLKHLASPTYSHRFFVDGTPVVQDITTRKILVGGLRGGGAGYYAIDITNPRPTTENALASNVLWEFPNASSSSTVLSQVGKSYGKPVIVKTTGGTWVVLITSGYNNTSGGNHLHVLNATTGALIRTITTPSGNGLAQVAAWVNNPTTDPTVDFVYGGDLSGNVWRFDLRDTNAANWSVVKLTSFPSTQPVTSTPELTTVKGRRMVLVTTGRMLGESDLAVNDTQSVYGLIDDTSTSTPTIANPRNTSVMFQQTLTIATGGIRNVTSNAIDYTTYKGWFFDLPAGERVSTDPSVAFGTLVFTSNQPSDTACSSQSFLYAVDIETGGQLPNSSFSSSPWTGRQVGFTLASRPVLVTLPSGSLVSLTHKSDASVQSSALPLAQNNRLRKHGWREILR